MFRAILRADWLNAVFIHYACDPRRLQAHVPFELDTREGVAYVSLVAFTQRRLRPATGGRLAEVLSAPLACHEFLNVRTYVRVGDERGIHFTAEWIPNRLAALIGPPLYGLPYHVGRLAYARDEASGVVTGVVCGRGGRVEFEGRTTGHAPVPATPDSLDAFLVERYTAWTHRRGIARRFHIRHDPWPRAALDVSVTRDDLLAGSCGGMLAGAKPVAAHFSPGVCDVRIGPPRRCAAGVTRPT